MTNDRVLPDRNVSAALLAIRLSSAATFLYHGAGILFGAFGGPGLQKFAAFTHNPLPIAFLVGLGEFGGGLAMLTGILTRIGAAGIAVIMVGAIVIVHKTSFDIGAKPPGGEFAIAHLAIALAILFAGPGRYTLLPASLRRHPLA